MSRPEPTTGTASGTVFYDDAITPITDEATTAQMINKTDGGSVGDAKALENGVFKVEGPAGDFVINIINNGTVIGSIEINIVVGVDIDGQNVVTNRGLGL